MARRTLLRHARRAYPAEACGLLLGTPGGSRIARALPCRNRAKEPNRTFRIEPDAYLRAEQIAATRGQVVLGFYHSHPDGEPAPSGLDAAHAALWPDTIWLIVPVYQGRPAAVAAFLSDLSRAAGRPALHAVPVRDAVTTAPSKGDP
jgi:proteasome lid subunit RPN8/RPN11